MSNSLTNPTVPILATAAATTAIAAYLNAKHHIHHDLVNGRGGLTPTQKDLDFLASRVDQKRILNYHILSEQAAKQPNHPALIFEGRTWSYAELMDGVTRVGNWLVEELGVAVGEVVAIDGGNSPEYLLLWFALDAVGASISFVNWNLTGEGLVPCVKVCFLPYRVPP